MKSKIQSATQLLDDRIRANDELISELRAALEVAKSESANRKPIPFPIGTSAPDAIIYRPRRAA